MSAGAQAADGEITYVYLLMCQDGAGPLYVRFGVSQTPAAALDENLLGCPIPPQVFSVVRAGAALQAGLLQQFRAFRVQGAWFRFDPHEADHAALFKLGCRLQLDQHVGSAVTWTQLPVPAVDDSARRAAWAPAREQAAATRRARAGQRSAARDQAFYRRNFEPASSAS